MTLADFQNSFGTLLDRARKLQQNPCHISEVDVVGMLT